MFGRHPRRASEGSAMRRHLGRRMLAAALLSASFVLLFESGAGAAPRSRQALAPTLRKEMKELVAAGVPGVVVLVQRDGSTLRIASGYSNRSTRAPMRVNDRFRIGSVTKSFVATVVLELVGERKLSLSDSVERWLPGLVPNGRKITLRLLLSHRSGLFNYTDDPRVIKPYLSGNFDYVWTPRRLVALSTSHKPLFAPGAKFSYSNTNYLLLGLIVEAATGHPIGAELSRRIFQPLQLRATSFDISPRIGGEYAHGYLIRSERFQDTSFLSPSWAWAAGAIVSTADDVARFYRALLGGRLLHADLLRAMEATRDDYGLGLARAQVPPSWGPCGPFLGHDGAIAGYRAYAFNTKDGRKQAVVLANSLTFVTEEIGNKRAQAALLKILKTALCA
jgi:D-alanyl-D-alanine carboxypeptidase